MNTNTFRALEKAKAKYERLQQTVEKERSKELAKLPSKFGFDSVNDFISAVKSAAGGRGGGGGKVAGKTRRKRAVITDQTRAEVKKLVGAGKTGNEIAKTVGISLPSVQNIKKALGLVDSRKKK
jgi:hypothetical protein